MFNLRGLRIVILSPSQMKTFALCERMWAFEKIWRMPHGTASYGMTYGNVLHAVIERYLGADASGRGPDGELVDLYPTGWQWDESLNRIEETDEAPLQQMVEEAISKGYLVRRPDARVEEPFLLPLIFDPANPLAPSAWITGRVDLEAPGEVQDHKGSNGWRYALSDEKVRDDLQMLTYGAVNLMKHPDHEGVVLRHNQFNRRDPEVRTRGDKEPVPATKLREHWDVLVAIAGDMLAAAQLAKKLGEHRWEEFPHKFGEACNSYGGCRFLRICTKEETPKEFRRRYLRLRLPMAFESEVPMSLKDRIAKAKGEAPAPTTEGGKPGSDTRPDPQQQGTRTGFTVLRGCLPVKGDGDVVTIADALKIAVVDIGGDTMPEFYGADGFKRRDKLREIAGQVAERLGGKILYSPLAVSTDEKDLLSALVPFATFEIVATAA